VAPVEPLQVKLAGQLYAAANAFQRDGDVWTVRYGGRALRLKDGKGPRYLAILLAAPGRVVLRTQIGKLLDVQPALGRHLRDAVRTGTVCIYAPGTPVDWEVGFG
jgi:hypothetical protein